MHGWAKRRRLRAAGIGCLVVGVLLAAVVAPAAYRWNRRWSGHFEARDYAWLRGMYSPARVGHMPAAIPPGATGVRIYAPGVYGLLPSPDQAAAVAAAAGKRAIPATEASVSFTPHLTTTEDRASRAGVSSPLSHYLLSEAPGALTGVSISPATGEVVYWFYEF